MDKPQVVAIFVSPTAGGQMQEVDEVEAVQGKGLSGDRYCTGEGSFNRENVGKRQVTLINAIFFPGTSFKYADTRRNIVVQNMELMDLIGKEFLVGESTFRGVKYCDPCTRPSRLSGNSDSFKEAFSDRGGLIAEIVVSGKIRKGDAIVPPRKDY